MSSVHALPINRLSESERSDASAGDQGIYGSTTTTTHTVHTTTTFFRLPRRKKAAPMFDLSHLPKQSDRKTPPLALHVPRKSDAGSSAPSDSSRQRLQTPIGQDAHNFSTSTLSHTHPSPTRSPVKPSTSFGVHTLGTQLLRHGSNASSSRSSPSRRRLGVRDRSSTLTSMHNGNEESLATPAVSSTRTSTSAGRKSFGDLFGITSRIRHNSEPQSGLSGPATPRSAGSKNNSISLPREQLVLPERHVDDTPANYLKRLEEVVSRGAVTTVLCKSNDPFSQAVLRSYMRGFAFFGDPMDIAIRKLLMEAELPKETQHIDRCLQGFANRYHECNPGIYASPDQAYFIAFSLLILHTDVFNKNNKHKMQKHEYLRNTKGEGVSDDVLECFYDNIYYTPFIHVEDDLDINGERIIQHKSRKKTIFPRASTDTLRRGKPEPVDPYALILDNKIQSLRPEFKNSMHLEEHYTYIGTAQSLNLQEVQKTFFRTGVLQIVSARSRPDAFLSEKTVINTQDAHPGIVDIKITKVGLLWRKDTKKKKTRSPWQEWGAILTGAQLYFFRNTAWVKSLMSQLESHKKDGYDASPVIFTPPLEHFKPDALMSTDDAVALLDHDYKKHKNAFVFVRHGGFEETFLADNEEEMNDWLAKLNYAAAFRTSGVRMRGVVGGNYDGQKSRGIRRLDNHSELSKSIQTPSGEVTINSGKIDIKMAHDILVARRHIMLQKVAEATEKIAAAQKQLDNQLRNARHLQILTPIQPKTREQLLLAAGRMSAQLKWSRMELWRLRCHKDILTMDLEEERSEGSGIIKASSLAVHLAPERAAPGRMQSATSEASIHRSQQSPPRSISTRPSTAHPSRRSLDRLDSSDDNTARPQTSLMHNALASWELPPLNFDSENRGARKTSVSSVVASSPISNKTAPSSSTKSPSSRENDCTSPDAAEKSILEQAGLVKADMTKREDGERTEGKDQVDDLDKPDRSKIRRSLHRTLREAHVPVQHHRSRKGKDPAHSDGRSEEPSEDVLSRGTGSFTVHGKKASVITFGTELSQLTSDERRRLRDQPRKGQGEGLTSPASIDDFHSILAEPTSFHERHGSGASDSTATGQSLQPLRNHLSASAPYEQAAASEVSSISDDQQTERAYMESDDDHEGAGRQAIFYTPEMSNSPVETGAGLKAKRSSIVDSIKLSQDQ